MSARGVSIGQDVHGPAPGAPAIALCSTNVQGRAVRAFAPGRVQEQMATDRAPGPRPSLGGVLRQRPGRLEERRSRGRVSTWDVQDASAPRRVVCGPARLNLRNSSFLGVAMASRGIRAYGVGLRHPKGVLTYIFRTGLSPRISLSARFPQDQFPMHKTTFGRGSVLQSAGTLIGYPHRRAGSVGGAAG